jgi:N-formylglutamate amidohydrolase
MAAQSVAGVCTVSRVGTSQPKVLFELPHGATRRRHYDAVRARLKSTLPERLEHFFFVNTDVGSPEVALEAAQLLAGRKRSPLFERLVGKRFRPVASLLVRSEIPRTFIDCNRASASTAAALKSGGLTGLLPTYIDHPDDELYLRDLHARYHAVAAAAWQRVCGDHGGLGVAVHTYAPRSVGITTVDAGIVRALEAAYVPEVYATWPERPAVDLITRAPDGEWLAPESVVWKAHEAFAAAGHAPTENASYTLHPGTMGEHYARQHPGRAFSLEFRRDLLAAPFRPFDEMRIGRAQVAPLGAALAASVAAHFA